MHTPSRYGFFYVHARGSPSGLIMPPVPPTCVVGLSHCGMQAWQSDVFKQNPKIAIVSSTEIRPLRPF